MKLKHNRQEVINHLKKRDGFLCFICKKPFDYNERPTIDHWIPRAAGGPDDFDNYRLAHLECNTKKGDLVPNEDGSIPARVKSNFRTRKTNKREVLSKLCTVCNDGRKLSADQTCNDCGSGAGPYDAPHYLKRPSPQCDHNIYWCWACCIGIVERKSALMSLLTG